jgi:hypothetical protein
MALIDNQLFESSAEAIEQTCFMLLLPDPPQPAGWTERAVYVDYQGPFLGRLVISVNQELYSAVASAMLGLGEPDEAQKMDALTEMANIIGGNIFPRISEGIFRMTAKGPCDPHDPAKGMEPAFRAQAELCVEEGRFTVQALWTAPFPKTQEA